MLTVDFERLALRPGMTVLDEGCGQGRHSLELLRRGCHALALDLNLAELKYTRFLLDSRKRVYFRSARDRSRASAWQPRRSSSRL